jgi:hypothetical protein
LPKLPYLAFQQDQDIVFFNAVAQAPSQGVQIIQPILTYGANDPPGNTTNWVIAAYYIDSSGGVYYYGSENTTPPVQPNDIIEMEVVTTYDYVHGQYAYEAIAQDNTKNYGWAILVDTNFDDNPFTIAYLANLEVHEFWNCGMLPPNFDVETFTYAGLYTTGGEVYQNSWTQVGPPALTVSGELPNCSFGTDIENGPPVAIQLWGDN